MDSFICRTCELNVTSFRYIKSKTGKLNRLLDCRSCERKKSRDSRKARYSTEEGRDSILKSNRKYMNKPEVIDRMSLLGIRKYADSIEFRENMKEKARDWRFCNHEKKSKTASRYYQKNKSEIQRKSREKQLRNPWLRLIGNIRSRVSEALRSSGNPKNGCSVFNNLPYTIVDLKKHLETHKDWDDSWMTWSCYGIESKSCGKSWQLDHIIPQSMFNYTSMEDEEFKLCWSLLNLRPYESRSNFSDGNRKDILGDFTSFNEIIDNLKSALIDPPIGESINNIYERLNNLKLGVECPMTNYGLKYLDGIFLNRFKSRTVRNSSLIEAVSDKHLILRVVTHLILSGSNITTTSILSNLKYITRTPGHFFPGATSAIWRNYAIKGSPVFDPFLGWGGRTLGAFCSEVDKIVGCDLQPEVLAGCNKIASDFKLISETKSEFYPIDCISYLKNSDEMFGLIFSSPPYMDIENYGVESDAMREDWIDSFIFPFIEECKKHLKDGGHIALHLKDLKGAPTFTAYYSALKASGFKQIKKHKYGRTKLQAVYVYGL